MARRTRATGRVGWVGITAANTDAPVADVSTQLVQTSSSSNQTLDGSASTGDGISYQWTLAGPSGHGASITSATSASATLTGIDTAGAYNCTLTITDRFGRQAQRVKTIDYSASSSTGWVDVVDVDFTSATTQSLTDGQENTLTGTSHVFWVDGLSGTGSMTVTNGTGLEVNWEKQNNSRAVFLYKFPTLAKVAGEYPRLRLAISFSGINMVTNNDYFGLWCNGQAFTGTQKVPIWKAFLQRSSSTTHV